MDILIPAISIPVLDQTDVLVCGASCAGITAAVRAARQGCRVALTDIHIHQRSLITDGVYLEDVPEG